jgi:hypothetical protein
LLPGLRSPTWSRISRSNRLGLLRLVGSHEELLIDKRVAYGRSYSAGTQPPPEEPDSDEVPGPDRDDEGLLTVERMKLPGKLQDWTGTVMYPNEDSAVWDVNRKLHLMPIIPAC